MFPLFFQLWAYLNGKIFFLRKYGSSNYDKHKWIKEIISKLDLPAVTLFDNLMVSLFYLTVKGGIAWQMLVKAIYDFFENEWTWLTLSARAIDRSSPHASFSRMLHARDCCVRVVRNRMGSFRFSHRTSAATSDALASGPTFPSISHYGSRDIFPWILVVVKTATWCSFLDIIDQTSKLPTQ